MSDTPQGPGWWQASDGKWYPPHGQGAPPGTPPEKQRGCLKTGLIVVGVLVVLGALAGALGSGGDKEKEIVDAGRSAAKDATSGGESPTTTAAAGDPTAPAPAGKLFPGRPDSQPKDQERNIGQAAQLSGYTATVTEAAFVQEVSQFERDGYLAIAVTIANRDQKAQRYSPTDWRLQTPQGTVQDGSFTTADDQLGSGDLVAGGTVSGKVYFEVGTAKGDFFVVYKPDPFDAARGIWKVVL